MTLIAARPFAFGQSRNTIIAASVVLLHVAALWALQAGLRHRDRDAQIVVPVEMLSEMVEPQAPKVELPTPVAPPAPPPLTHHPVVRHVVCPRPAPHPAPQPVAVADPTPALQAPSEATTPPSEEATPAPQAPAAVATPPAPAKIELPSSNADYLQNPKPPYPAISKRLGEQGKVVVRVLIGADGLPQKAELKQSSGFDRLDHVALETVMKWRYVPGKRGGVAEAMWVNVPINFVLE